MSLKSPDSGFIDPPWSVFVFESAERKEGPRAPSPRSTSALTRTYIHPCYTHRVPTWTAGKHAGNRGSPAQSIHLSATVCEEVRTTRGACNIRSWTPEIALKPPITQCTRPSAVCGGSDCLCDSRSTEELQVEAIAPNHAGDRRKNDTSRASIPANPKDRYIFSE